MWPSWTVRLQLACTRSHAVRVLEAQLLNAHPGGWRAELRRCELLGLQLYNFHPGAWKGWKKKEYALEQVPSLLPHSHCHTGSSNTLLRASSERLSAL